jgi:aspartyl/glutamyl-tRNA(Asn/Gln) amidotransferase C subunit
VTKTFSNQVVRHVAELANIPITDNEAQTLESAFEETIGVVGHLSEVSTNSTEPTHQVTGLENIWREDQVTAERMFTQAEALANAQSTHEGFFVVPQVIDQD